MTSTSKNICSFIVSWSPSYILFQWPVIFFPCFPPLFSRKKKKKKGANFKTWITFIVLLEVSWCPPAVPQLTHTLLPLRKQALRIVSTCIITFTPVCYSSWFTGDSKSRDLVFVFVLCMYLKFLEWCLTPRYPEKLFGEKMSDEKEHTWFLFQR